MRKILFAVCMALCSITAARAQGDSYRIEGRLGRPLNTQVVLIAETEKGVMELSDAAITDGNFEFTGRMPETTVVYLMPAKKDMVLATILLENASYTITAGAEGLIVEGGGEAQKAWKEFEGVSNYLTLNQQRIQEQARKATNPTQLAGLQSEFRKIAQTVYDRENELIGKYGNSMVAAYVVASKIQGLDAERLSARYELLGDDAKATFYGKRVAAMVDRLEQVAVGAVAPDFTAPLADGGVLSLHEAKAKVKVVNFWISQHRPCRQENLNMLQIYKRFRPKGLEIISVSLDDNKQAWQKAIGEDGSNWKNVSDLKGKASEMGALYCVSALPCNFILDGENRIVAKNLFGKALEQKVSEMLKKKK